MLATLTTAAHLDGCGVTALVLAVTSWTELLLSAFDVFMKVGQNNIVAVAEKKKLNEMAVAQIKGLIAMV